jgi:hypothetical protein
MKKPTSDQHDRFLFWLCIIVAIVMGLAFISRFFR